MIFRCRCIRPFPSLESSPFWAIPHPPDKMPSRLHALLNVVLGNLGTNIRFHFSRSTILAIVPDFVFSLHRLSPILLLSRYFFGFFFYPVDAIQENSPLCSLVSFYSWSGDCLDFLWKVNLIAPTLEVPPRLRLRSLEALGIFFLGAGTTPFFSLLFLPVRLPFCRGLFTNRRGQSPSGRRPFSHQLLDHLRSGGPNFFSFKMLRYLLVVDRYP